MDAFRPTRGRVLASFWTLVPKKHEISDQDETDVVNLQEISHNPPKKNILLSYLLSYNEMKIHFGVCQLPLLPAELLRNVEIIAEF